MKVKLHLSNTVHVCGLVYVHVGMNGRSHLFRNNALLTMQQCIISTSIIDSKFFHKEAM